MTIRGLIIVAALALGAPALAAENPVDPYVQSNANAGARPFDDDALLKAFHGPDGVGRIVDEMLEGTTKDPRTADIFRATDMERLRRTLKEQLVYLLGGKVDYTGRDMKSVHRDQGVQQTDFNILVEYLQIAMDHEHVPFRAQNRLLAKLAPMQKDIVVR
jgi:hemoglobin